MPTIAYRVDDVALFADQVFDRLRNPFTVHRLSDIALHHADKSRIRLQSTGRSTRNCLAKRPGTWPRPSRREQPCDPLSGDGQPGE